VLSGGTKLTLDLASKLEKPVFHIYDTRKERISKADSLRFGIQALTDFLCSNKIEILNVAGPRESKEPGVYEWTLKMLRFLNRARDPQKQPGEVRVGEGRVGDRALGQRLF
jgi:Circularly permutated YpsA SLOG family